MSAITRARDEANDFRIDALYRSTGKPHLFVWSMPEVPTHRPEWIYDGPSNGTYAAMYAWMEYMDETHPLTKGRV